MRKKSTLRIFIGAIVLLLTVSCLGLHSFAIDYTPDGKSYELPEDSKYNLSGVDTIDKFTYGRKTMGSFQLAGPIDDNKMYWGTNAYSTSGTVYFGYTYDGAYQTDNKDAWNLISDNDKEINGIKLPKKMGNGVLIVQRSSNKYDWENALDPIVDFFSSHTSGLGQAYTPSDEEIKNGMYYRVIVAYKMARRTQVGSGIFQSDQYDYRECVEVYEFYIESCKNFVQFRDMVTRSELGNRATTNSGFYICRNNSTDTIKVSKDGGAFAYASDFDHYSAPGTYTIEIETNLGKKHTYTITVTQGMALTQLKPSVYESKKNDGFPMDNLISGETVFGRSSLTELYLAQTADASISTSHRNGFPSYGITGNSLSLFLKLNASDGNIGRGWNIEYDKWGKREKETICGVHTGEIGKGAIVIQTSSDGVNWTNADMGKYAEGLYSTDFASRYNTKELVLAYTPDGEDILNGVYIRLLFAYQVYKAEGRDYQDYIEKYDFYLCSNELNAVTIHNLSVKGTVEDILGDEDETTVSLYKNAETMKSGDCTTTGFTIDTSMNPTVRCSVMWNGIPISLATGAEVINNGIYSIVFTSAVGDQREVVIYVDRQSPQESLKNYFGEGFLQGKRIYAEGEYPVYEANKVSYHINEVSGYYLPLCGTITNQTTGSVIDIAHNREAKGGTITEPGQYIAQFVTNPGYDKEGASGDTRVFTFRFSVIAEGTAPGPVVNQKNLKAYSQSNVSDAYPMYYGLTYRSAAKGNITVAFATREAALEYAYNYEKGMVEKQEDGSFRYTGSLKVSQKETYHSAWDLTDALYFFAEQAIEVLYFDMSDQFTYLTLSDEVLGDISNLRTLELDRSVTIFAEGQKEQLCALSGLPVLSPKPYAFLTPGLNGSVTSEYLDFEFIKDKYGCDSSSVTIIDCNGKEYAIAYNSPVGAQLQSMGCPSGIVTIKENTIYGDEASYQAIFIAANDNTSNLTIEYFAGEENDQITFSQNSIVRTIAVDAFRISSLIDNLDPLNLVTITGPSGKYYYLSGQLVTEAWAEPGEYTVSVTNRLGFGYSIQIIVNESDYGTIEFSGEGTDGIATIVTKYGTAVELPQLTQYGYDLVGYEDENGTMYSTQIDEIVFTGRLVLQAVWKAKQYKLSFLDANGNELLDSRTVEFGKNYTLPEPALPDGVIFLGWSYNGDILENTTLTIEEEGDIVLLAITDNSSYSTPDNNSGQSNSNNTTGKVVAIVACVVAVTAGGLALLCWRKKTNGRNK